MTKKNKIILLQVMVKHGQRESLGLHIAISIYSFYKLILCRVWGPTRALTLNSIMEFTSKCSHSFLYGSTTFLLCLTLLNNHATHLLYLPNFESMLLLLYVTQNSFRLLQFDKIIIDIFQN